MITENFFNPTLSLLCIITGAGECGKSKFLTILVSNISYEFEKIYIFAPSLHQDLYQK